MRSFITKVAPLHSERGIGVQSKLVAGLLLVSPSFTFLSPAALQEPGASSSESQDGSGSSGSDVGGAGQEGQRDPFGASDLLEDLREDAVKEDPNAFKPALVGVRRPSILLRGYIEDASQEPLALVEINGGSPLVVREGDTISLQDGASNTVIQVVSVGNLSVSVRVGTIEELLIIR